MAPIPKQDVFLAGELLLIIASFADVATLAKLVQVDRRCCWLITPVLFRTAVTEKKIPILQWAAKHGKNETIVGGLPASRVALSQLSLDAVTPMGSTQVVKVSL